MAIVGDSTGLDTLCDPVTLDQRPIGGKLRRDPSIQCRIVHV